MFEQIIGTACVLGVAIVAFVAGLACGALSTRGHAKKWIDEHACWPCQEKFNKSPFDL